MSDSEIQKEMISFDEIPLDERSFIQRTFGKMEAGSMRGGIFSLVSTAIGAGCLLIPLVFSELGIILGFILLFLAAFLSYAGLMGIAKSAASNNTYDYSLLVSKTLGNRTGLFIKMIIILYVYGTILGYQIMIGKFVPSICHSINLHYSETEERILAMVCVNVLIAIPLGLFKKLTSLRFISILSVLTLCYITIVTIGQFPYYTEQNNYDKIKYFDVNLNIFPSFAYMMYAFTCHTNIVQVQKELRNTSIRRISKVALRSIITMMIPYSLLGLFGYLSIMNDIPALYIMRDTADSIHNDWLMVLARVLMSITLLFAIPINLPPCRSIIMGLILGEGKEPSLAMHASVTISLLVTTLIIAIVFPAIQIVFGLLGGICCGVFVLLVPNLLRAIDKGRALWQRILIISFAAFFMLIGFTGAILNSAGVTT